MSNAAAFRKKSVVIEAMQWDGTAEGATPIIDWILAGSSTARYECSNPERCAENDGDVPHAIAIDTLEGTMRATVGDWAIRGVRGEHYPCKPDIFDATYEPVRIDDFDGDDVGTGWRIITTDTESNSGVAPVCPRQDDPGAHALPDIDSADVVGVYDCCPEPHLQCWTESGAREVAALLNRLGVEVCD